MVEAVFEQSCQAARRLAAVRSAAMVTLHGLPQDTRPDLEQEALLELWRKRTAYDAQRGSWRTFAERVVTNRLVSLRRRMYSSINGQFREEPLAMLTTLAAPDDRADLRADVARVLNGVSRFDRSVALCLIDHTAIETSQRLDVSKATTYRAITRLRAAFTEAGLSPGRHAYGCVQHRNAVDE